jgi:predicted transcriptional regulator
MGFNDDSVSKLRSILTEERLSLLRIIHKINPRSIRELSANTKRDYRNVYNDVKLLQDAHFLKLARHKKGNTPIVDYDLLEIVMKI